EAFPFPTTRLADVNGDGVPDLILASQLDSNTHVLLGNGDGSFRPGPNIPSIGPGLAVADLNGDHIPDVVTAAYVNNTVYYALGKGDGTFTKVTQLSTGNSPVGVTVSDFGSAVKQPDGTTVLGPSDGHPDLLVAASGAAQVILIGPPQV